MTAFEHGTLAAVFAAEDAEAFVVTHVGPSDTVDLGEHPGAIDADVELPGGWSVSVTLLPERGRWSPRGDPGDWLSDPSAVAEPDHGALVTAVNAAARAIRLSVEGGRLPRRDASARRTTADGIQCRRELHIPQLTLPDCVRDDVQRLRSLYAGRHLDNPSAEVRIYRRRYLRSLVGQIRGRVRHVHSRGWGFWL